MDYGFFDGWGRMGDAMRRILFGYDMSNPKDKQAKENLEHAVETPTSEIVTGIKWDFDPKDGLLLFGIIALVILVFKD